MKLTLSKRLFALILVICLAISLFNTYLIIDQRQVFLDTAKDSTYDYVIFQDGNSYGARNTATLQTDISSNNASMVINTALVKGNSLYIKSGNYSLNSDINVHNKKNARIVGDEAKIIGNGKSIIVKGNNYTNSQNNFVSGLILVNGTLRIENSFRTTITNMVFINCTTALKLSNSRTWTEGTEIENCRFENSKESIVFETPSNSATGSYASSKISRCFFNIIDDSVGVVVEELAEFSDSQFQDIRMWMGESGFMHNQTGLLVKGSMHQTMLVGVVFESFANQPDQLYAMSFGETSITPPILAGAVSFLGNWTAKIYNPFNKWISGMGSVFKQENLGISLGLNGQYGSALVLHLRPLTITAFKPKIAVQGSFAQNETITVRFRLEFVDNSISQSIEKSFRNSTTLWLNDDDILEMFPSQSLIWNLLVDAKASSASTDARILVSIYGVAM